MTNHGDCIGLSDIAVRQTERVSLVTRMEQLADQGHPFAAELRERAQAFREAIDGYWASPQTITPQQFLGRWARARRLYCEITGEPLI